jgi:hypothetical protein
MHGNAKNAGYAPYLDYRAPKPDEMPCVEKILEDLPWQRTELEGKVLDYAVSHIVPKHLEEIRSTREALIKKVEAAVKDRLTKEITHWDSMAQKLKEEERAGKRNARMNSELARRRSEELRTRLRNRLADLEQERKISAVPPVVIGAALVVPARMLQKDVMPEEAETGLFGKDRKLIESLAMEAVMKVEQKLGYEPKDVSYQNLGYDIESSIPGTGKLRFIEVKGRTAGASSVTVTKNEILTALNKPEDFILALVEVDGEQTVPHYIRQPFGREPDFGVTSVNYQISELLENEVHFT